MERIVLHPSRSFAESGALADPLFFSEPVSASSHTRVMLDPHQGPGRLPERADRDDADIDSFDAESLKG